MVDQNPDEFKIGFSRNESETGDAAMREEILEQRLEKLSIRVTLIAILVPVLIFVIFAFAYLDIKDRVFRMHDTGVDRLQRLSRELESKFSSLSIRLAQFEDSFSEREKALVALEESFSQKINPMEQSYSNMTRSINNLNEDIQKLENSLKEIESVQKNKADQKELDRQLESIGKSFDATRKDMQTLMDQMEALDKNFKSELKLLTDYLAKEKKRQDETLGSISGFAEELGRVRSEVQSLKKRTDGMVHADQLPLAVERARLQLKVSLDEAVTKMQNRIDVLERQISLLSTQSGVIMERNLQ